MYTFSDYLEAKRKAAEADSIVSLKVKEQAQAREEAEAMLARLDREIEPLEDKQTKARLKLESMIVRLLGPWKVSEHYDTARILRRGGTDECWDNRVWLRMVCRKERTPNWQWEVSIKGIGYGSKGSKEVVFGPLEGPRRQDFEAQQRKTEKLLVEMGYILEE